MNRKKLTKNQILKQISNGNHPSNTENAYDLNATGGFISDMMDKVTKLYLYK